jgi:dienelactone hydrolase
MRTVTLGSLLIVLIAISTAAFAETTGKTVEYVYNGQKFEGYLAYDSSLAADAKKPGILVIPEWWGLNDYAKMRADQLAAAGYVAFAADMYGAGANTTDAKKAKELSGALYGKPEMVTHAQAALDQLLKSDHVDPKKIAAIGFCFGGSACQQLAYTGAPLAGIVSFHGGLVQPTDADLKNIRCKFLILNGGIDPNVKPEAIASYLKALDSAHIDYQFINYAGALHAFTNPDADKLAAANGMVGMVGYNANAARRSWAQMKVFFDELFGN